MKNTKPSPTPSFLAAARMLAILGFALLLPASLQAGLVTNIYNVSTTFTPPAGVTVISVAVQGGGGGGGGGGGASGGRGGGGGGGACAFSSALTVSDAVTYTVTIGNGGTAGAATSGTGGAGVASSFSGSGITTHTANGGAGGALGGVNGVTVPAGGAASGGTVNRSGGNGTVCKAGTASGGGGGGAGTASAGANAVTFTGGGGGTGSPAGGAGGGNGNSGNTVGTVGTVPGGGGGGGYSGTTARAGGVGGKGQVTLVYTENSKADNQDNLNLASSWIYSVPTSSEVAVWDNTVTAANTTALGADTTWAGIQIVNPGGLVTINAGNTLTLGAAAIDFNMTNATANLTLNCDLVLGAANVWNVTNLRTLTLNGVVSGANDITKQGAGTAILTAANNYTGATLINGGTVSVSSLNSVNGGIPLLASSSLGAPTTVADGTIQLGSPGRLLYTGPGEITDRVINLNVATGVITIDQSGAGLLKFTSDFTATVNGAKTLTLQGSTAGTGEISGAIVDSSSGATTLLKAGTNTWMLSGVNTYTGTTFVTNGTLSLTGNRTVIPTAAVSYDVGGIGSPLATLNLGGDLPLGTTQIRVGVNGPGTASQTNGLVSFSGTSGNELTVGITASMPGIYNLSGGTLQTVAVANRGVVLGVNNNSIGTFNLSGGTLTMTSGSVLAICRGDNVTAIGATGTFNQTGGTATVGALRMGGNSGFATLGADSTASLNLSGGTFSAVSFTHLSGGNTSTSSISIGASAAVTLPAFPTTRGSSSTATITFDGGSLSPTAASANYMSNLTSAKIKAGGASFDVGSGNDITIVQDLLTDDVSTGGGLTKNGSGVLTLTGANTYTGATTISNGTLLVNNTTGSGTGTGAVTVNGGTLGGNGTISGTVTVSSSGALAAGASIGALTVSGAATNNGTIIAEITNGPSADKIVFSGSVHNLGGTLTVTNVGTLVNGTTYDLFDFTGGAPTGVAFAATNLPGGLSHWNTSDLLVGGTITFANNAPVAASFTNGVAVGGSTTTEVVGKYASDADGDVLTITVVSAPANGTASIVGGTNITYVSTNSAAGDSFTYTVSDGLTSSTATVTVSTYSPEGFNRLSPPSVIGAGTVTLSYLGIPGYNYALDWATNLTPPINWMAVVTNTAAGNGALNYTNTSTEPVNFFRTRSVP